MLRSLLRRLRRGLPRPVPPSVGLARQRAWYLFGERAMDDCNARVAARLAALGADPARSDLPLVCYEDFQRGVAALVLPGSRSLPVDLVAAGLAVAFAERHLETRAAARRWLACAEEFWVMTGLGMKKGNE